MSLVVGNKSNTVSNPGAATSLTWSHTQNAGGNGYLIVSTAISSSDAPIGVTYAGQTMTLIDSRTVSVTAMNLSTWVLMSPPTGANNVVVSWSSGPYNPCSLACQSLTGASSYGSIGYTDTSGPPTSVSINVLNNSVIWCIGIAGTAGTNVTINGTSETIDWNNNANNYHFGGISTNLLAGSITSSTNALAQTATLAIEIQQAGLARNRAIWI